MDLGLGHRMASGLSASLFLLTSQAGWMFQTHIQRYAHSRKGRGLLILVSGQLYSVGKGNGRSFANAKELGKKLGYALIYK